MPLNWQLNSFIQKHCDLKQIYLVKVSTQQDIVLRKLGKCFKVLEKRLRVNKLCVLLHLIAFACLEFG